MPKRNGSGIALLADPTRRQIVGLLAVRSLRPSTIATEVGLSRPATSRQLRLLRNAGLISGRQSRFDRMVRAAGAWAAGAWAAGPAPREGLLEIVLELP